MSLRNDAVIYEIACKAAIACHKSPLGEKVHITFENEDQFWSFSSELLWLVDYYPHCFYWLWLLASLGDSNAIDNGDT